jgi:hypothetical protein
MIEYITICVYGSKNERYKDLCCKLNIEQAVKLAENCLIF